MKQLSFLILIMITITACKKYEDGPMISTKSVEKRLYQDWVEVDYNKPTGWIWNIKPDTSVIWGSKVETQLLEGQTVLQFTQIWNPPTTVLPWVYKFKILRLTSNELWVEVISGFYQNQNVGDVHHFESQ